MKRLLCIVAMLFAAAAARGESFTLRVDESVTIDIPGATAAYAIDPSIADVTTPGAGRVSIAGRSAGKTQLIAITATGTKAYLITVAAPRVEAAPASSGEPAGRYEARYASGSAQLQNVIDVFTERGDRRTHLHVLNVHYLEETFGRASNAFPSVYYRVTTPRRELTLLDDLVDLSPVIVRSTQIRGLHLRQRGLELHAGYAASTMYEDLFLPADRRWVAGAGYGLQRGNIRFIPSVYAFLSEPAGTAARRGVVGSLAAEHQRGDALFLRGEIGVSRSLAASADLRYDSASDRVRARAWLKPDDFPTLGLNDTPGLHGELEWNRRATSRLTIDSYAVFDRFDLPAIEQTIGVANVGVRYALSPRIALAGGADATIHRSGGDSIRTVAVPIGLTWDTPSFGAAASYRVVDHSESNRHGDALRLSARASSGGFRASAWAERQRRVPTLDLIFRDTPGLEAALLRLGLSVRTPEDVARVLRDNAALVNLGFIEGVTVNLTPQRLMGGVDLGWIGAGAGRDQLRLHTIFSRDESVGSTRDLLFATLTYSRRLVAATDVYGSLSWWRSESNDLRNDDSAFEIGVRQRFEGVPAFLQRRGTIHGIVFLDPRMEGAPGTGTTPLEGIVVTLDGTRTATTDSKGEYAFPNVAAGRHRVAAQIPPSRAAFFTTPSPIETDAPARADFGLVWTPARISGRVMSDAGAGIGGAVVSIEPATGRTFTATTDAEGNFAVAVPTGDYTVAVAPESLPPGYDLRGEHEQRVSARPERPQEAIFEVQALRSVAGSVAGGPAEVTIEPLGRTATTDAEGNFVFRSLPAGTFTIVARRDARVERRSVTLPAEPALVRGIDVADPSAALAAADARAPEATQSAGSAPAGSDGAYLVQAGAFRIAANAAAARRRVERLGYRPRMMRVGDLDAVVIGPFATRGEAEEHEQRLARAGIDAVVLSDGALRVPPPRDAGAFVVQLGAFREPENARAAIERASRLGQSPFTVAANGLTIVRVGPFASRRAAIETSEHLREHGLETLVTTR